MRYPQWRSCSARSAGSGSSGVSGSRGVVASGRERPDPYFDVVPVGHLGGSLSLDDPSGDEQFTHTGRGFAEVHHDPRLAVGEVNQAGLHGSLIGRPVALAIPLLGGLAPGSGDVSALAAVAVVAVVASELAAGFDEAGRRWVVEDAEQWSLSAGDSSRAEFCQENPRSILWATARSGSRPIRRSRLTSVRPSLPDTSTSATSIRQS